MQRVPLRGQPGYFETMGIPLRRGRLLDARDPTGAPAPVLINESFAQRVFAGATRSASGCRSGPTDAPGTPLWAWSAT